MARKRPDNPDDGARPENEDAAHRNKPTRPRARAKAWKGPFLEVLKRTVNVSLACREIGVDRSTVIRARKSDASFDAGYIVALEEGIDALEGELLKRIVGGSYTERTREEYDGAGNLVRRTVERIRDPETRGLLSMLAAWRPEKWGRLDEQRLATWLARNVVETPDPSQPRRSLGR